MITKLENHQIVSLHDIDHAMFFGDPARPRALKHVLEGFRLADTVERFTQRVVDEAVDAFEHGPVLSQPVLILLPGVVREGQSHGVNLRTLALPFLAWASDSSRRLALAGERSK